jgi:threonine efflux protein
LKKFVLVDMPKLSEAKALNLLIKFWPDMLLVWGAFILAAGSPGPSNMMVMSTAMQEGRVKGLALAFGVSLGSITWGILTTAGVATLLIKYPQALSAIKIAGALYMFFLAFRSGRAAIGPDPAFKEAKASPNLGLTVLSGVLMHLTNPKAILGWTAIIALGLRDDMPMLVIVAMLLGCYILSLTLNTTYAMLFSSNAMIAGYRRVRRPVEWGLAGFFTLAGLKLLSMR